MNTVFSMPHIKSSISMRCCSVQQYNNEDFLENVRKWSSMTHT